MIATLILVLSTGISFGAKYERAQPLNPHDLSEFYPDPARRSGEQGTVLVHYTVDPDGRVSDVGVWASSGFPDLDDAAVRGVATWFFKPATRYGQPIAQPDTSVSIGFALKGLASAADTSRETEPCSWGQPTSGGDRIAGCTAFLATPRLTASGRAVGLRLRAHAELDSHQFDAARRDADEAIVLARTDPTAWVVRGDADLALQDYAQANADISRAIDLAPNNALPYFARAQLNVRLAKYREALIDLGRALELAPDAQVFSARASVEVFLGKLPEGLADATRASTLEPDNASYLLQRAEIMRRQSDYAGAIAAIDASVLARPSDPDILNGRCYLRAEMNRDMRAALDDCNKALQLRPDSSAIRDSRGFVYFRLGQYRQSLADLDSAVAINPKSANSLYVRGLVKLKLGDVAAGRADLTAATAIAPKTAAFFLSLGVAP